MSYLLPANAPLGLPDDVSALLQRWRLTVPGLLTAANAKMARSGGRAVILHHSPHRALARALTPGEAAPVAARGYLPEVAALARQNGMTAALLQWNGCAWATRGCAEACLRFSGHGGLTTAPAEASARKTAAMVDNPVAYGRAVLWAIAWHHRRAMEAVERLAVRLRGTDEGPNHCGGWHGLRLPVSAPERLRLARRYGLEVPAAGGPGDPQAGATLAELVGHAVDLWDYSKAPVGGPLGLQAIRAAGWDVTASMAPDAPDAARRAIDAIRAGFRVAVPVALGKGQPIPSRVELIGRGRGAVAVETVDGDRTDRRFDEPGGVAVILRAKKSRGARPDVAAPFFLDAPARPRPGEAVTIHLPDGEAVLTW